MEVLGKQKYYCFSLPSVLAEPPPRQQLTGAVGWACHRDVISAWPGAEEELGWAGQSRFLPG